MPERGYLLDYTGAVLVSFFFSFLLSFYVCNAHPLLRGVIGLHFCISHRRHLQIFAPYKSKRILAYEHQSRIRGHAKMNTLIGKSLLAHTNGRCAFVLIVYSRISREMCFDGGACIFQVCSFLGTPGEKSPFVCRQFYILCTIKYNHT